MIKEQISFDSQLGNAFSEEIRSLKIQNANQQELQMRKDQEYLEEIENIQEKCQMYIRQKENEISDLRHVEEDSAIRLESDSRRLHQQVHDLKIKNRELEEASEMNTLALTKRDRLAEERVKQMQSNFEKEERNYEAVIAKMKEDMHLIKNEWQRKCQETAAR